MSSNLSSPPLPSPSGLTSIAAFLLTREVWNTRAGLLSACCIAIVPGYISRSVAGSYDNEGIAIFALLFTFFLWLKSVKTGSIFWAAMASLSYFYMVTRTDNMISWGANKYFGNVWKYQFIINTKNTNCFQVGYQNVSSPPPSPQNAVFRTDVVAFLLTWGH